MDFSVFLLIFCSFLCGLSAPVYPGCAITTLDVVTIVLPHVCDTQRSVTRHPCCMNVVLLWCYIMLSANSWLLVATVLSIYGKLGGAWKTCLKIKILYIMMQIIYRPFLTYLLMLVYIQHLFAHCLRIEVIPSVCI